LLENAIAKILRMKGVALPVVEVVVTGVVIAVATVVVINVIAVAVIAVNLRQASIIGDAFSI
jgi:hypothetical protein